MASDDLDDFEFFDEHKEKGQPKKAGTTERSTYSEAIRDEFKRLKISDEFFQEKIEVKKNISQLEELNKIEIRTLERLRQGVLGLNIVPTSTLYKNLAKILNTSLKTDH